MDRGGTFDLKTYAPSPPLVPHVQSFWILEATAENPEPRYFHPDGGSGFSLRYGDSGETPGTGIVMQARLTEPKPFRYSGTVRMVGVRFRPGGAFPFFGTDAPVEDVFGAAELRDLYGRIGEARRPEETLSLLETALLRRLDTAELSPLAIAALRSLETSHGIVRVERIAEKLDVTSRQLERVFRAQVGYAPKQLARILRARRAKRLLADRRALPLYDVGYSLGYADQAHFTREFKEVIGLTPAAYRRALKER